MLVSIKISSSIKTHRRKGDGADEAEKDTHGCQEPLVQHNTGKEEGRNDGMFFCRQLIRCCLPDLFDIYIYTLIEIDKDLIHFLMVAQEQIEEIYSQADPKQPFYDLYIKTTLTDIILRMLRGSLHHNIPSSPLPIQQVIAYIADNYLQKITLDDIARKYAFSAAYLGQLFKKQTGYTFNEYLNSLRLKHACNLLQNSPLAVKEIAYQSGYSSVEYFLHIFKKQLQMTPSEYRQLFTGQMPSEKRT